MKDKVNEYLIPYHWAWEGFYKNRHEYPLKLILHEFSRNDCVLDVGCGDGRLTYFMAEKVNSIVAVDNQDYPLKFARLIFDRLNVKNAEFKVEDITKLNFKDESFDKIACFDVIEHIPKDTAIMGIGELVRVLKKGGRLYLTTPNRKELRGRIFGHKMPDKHYYEYTKEEIRKLFEPYLKDMKVYGYYIPPVIPKAEHIANVIPFR